MATRAEWEAKVQEYVNKNIPLTVAQQNATRDLGTPVDEADDAPKTDEKKGIGEKITDTLTGVKDKIVETIKPVTTAIGNTASRVEQKATGESNVGKMGMPAKEARENKKQIKNNWAWDDRKVLKRLADNAQDEDDFIRSVMASDNLGKGNIPGAEDSLRKFYQGRKGDIIKKNYKVKTDGDPNGSAGPGGTSKLETNTGTGTTGEGSGDGDDGNPPPEGKGKDEWKPNKSYVGDKRAYSIWDAYKKGFLDKGGATYYTIDSIANFLKNTGRGIGNVGAQFTGGTIDNNVDQSEWNKAMSAMNKEERQKWIEGQGSQAERQAESELIANDISKINKGILSNRKDYMDYWKNKADEAAKEGNERQAVLYMAMAYGAPTDPYSVLQGQGIAGLMGGIEKGIAKAQEWYNNR